MYTTQQIADAASSLCPGADFGVRGTDLVWNDAQQKQPTPAEINAEIDRLAGQGVPSLKAYALEKRWLVEVGGLIANGIHVPTDDRAKLLLMGSAQLADADTAPLVINGVNCGVLTGQQFKSLYASVLSHVQNTFITLGAVLDGIASGAITTKEQIDQAFVPR